MKSNNKYKLFFDHFYSLHGRAPRILHIGNIANNAYINSKILNEAGFDSDVICYDYYHIMGCPEWEDAFFDTTEKINQFEPNWSNINLENFERPLWFAQGPMNLCINYLIAKRKGDVRSADKFWLKLSYKNRITKEPRIHKIISIFNVFFKRVFSLIRRVLFSILNKNPVLLRFSLKFNLISVNKKDNTYSFESQMSECRKNFIKLFPDRSDILEHKDMVLYRSNIQIFHKLFHYYDIIQAYSTDGLYPMLAAATPYIAFEHGTIRKIPYEVSAIGRLCSLTYRMADFVFITNADNMKSARKLGIKNFSFIPHPINEEGTLTENDKDHLYKHMHQKYKTNFIIFHPSRQHWSMERDENWDKGNDIFLRGFAKYVHEVNNQATVILVEWGSSVNETKKLIKDLLIEDRVIWVDPMPHLQMVRYIKGCDIVADQFIIGSFGSILPKAMALGKATLIYLNENFHAECFDNPPPVLNARNETEVFNQLAKCWENQKIIEKIGKKAKIWYQKNHSNDVILKKIMDVYSCILTNEGSLN